MLQQNIENIQRAVHRQRDIFNDLERKVHNIPKKLEEMQQKLLQNNIINLDDLKNFIANEIRTRIPATHAVDDKIVEVKEILRNHDHV